MKNLIYSSTLIFSFLAITACNKNDAIQPRKGLSQPDSIAAAAPPDRECDSSEPVKYVLNNNTGINSFIITFSGSSNYTFAFPANGSKTVAVKPGIYNIQIPPAGNFASHGFYMDNQPSVHAPTARYQNVKINPCSVTLQTSID
ncbi:MAG: hypothetical protein AAGC65_09465 [Mucilaginibacter sp.]|uniref:hypothetical protein n=1 Tax=Mucilaginibacter sp. TaxID=1882438 RepID=UPI0031AED387